MNVQAVRGRVDDDLAEELVAFWTSRRALDEATARERVAEVTAVVRDGSGELAGVATAFETDLELLSGRRFWVMRRLLLPHAADAVRALERVTYETLAAEAQGDGPVGVCFVLTAAEAAQRPEAEWPDPRTFHAGFLPDGRQARVAYFDGASIVAGRPPGPAGAWDLESGPPIERFDAQDAVSEDDVIAFWLREGAVDADAARRRVAQLHLIAADGDEIVGVSSRLLAHNAQLGMPMWYYRAFVGAAHRRSATAVRLAVTGRRLLEEAYVAGEDRRAGGIVYEVENEGLKQLFPDAIWMPTDFAFIGENAKSDHVRVHYFPGAKAPLGQGRT